jgi:hypothetical protein
MCGVRQDEPELTPLFMYIPKNPHPTRHSATTQSHSPPLCIRPLRRSVKDTNLGLYPPLRRSVEGGPLGMSIYHGFGLV